MPIAIRSARPEEAAGAVGAYEWLFAPPGSRPPAWDPEYAAGVLRELAAGDTGTVLVADDGELIGLCTVALDLRSARFGLRAWVEDLAVHPERRSLGVGRRLLDAAKDWAREHGATHLELDSSVTREDAHHFYEREQPSTRSLCYGWIL